MRKLKLHANEETVRAVPGWAAKVSPRPIRTCAEHKAALDELMRLERMMDAWTASKAEVDAVEVLKPLVAGYERRRFGEVANAGTPLGRLRYLIDWFEFLTSITYDSF